MSSWISVNTKLPSVGDFCQVLDRDGNVFHVFYTHDEGCSNTPENRYFASINNLTSSNNKYSFNEQFGEIVNVTHYALMPKLPASENKRGLQ